MHLRLAILTALILGTSASAHAQEEPDFLFGSPRGAFSLRGGVLLASAQGDIYDFFSETLTVESSDFNSAVFGVDVAIALHPRLDVLVGFEYSNAGVDSESRDFVEDDDSPILQRTELRTFPFTGSLKLYVTPRGRDISRFAFVPRKARVYVGAGGGLVYYRLRQFGDFVDFVDLSIFTGNFVSSGTSLGAHAFGGVDIQLTPKVYTSIEGRYLWADADLSGDFVGFDPIDLNGLRITAGINITF